MKQANIFGYVMGIIGNSHFRFDVKFRHEEDSRWYDLCLLHNIIQDILFEFSQSCVSLNPLLIHSLST